MKACIACAEEIQDAAKLCRFCRTRQDNPEFSKGADQVQDDAPAEFLHKEKVTIEHASTDASGAKFVFIVAAIVILAIAGTVLLPTISNNLPARGNQFTTASSECGLEGMNGLEEASNRLAAPNASHHQVTCLMEHFNLPQAERREVQSIIKSGGYGFYTQTFVEMSFSFTWKNLEQRAQVIFFRE